MLGLLSSVFSTVRSIARSRADSSTLPDASDEVSRFVANEGETYYVVVDGNNGALGSYTLTVVCEQG